MLDYEDHASRFELETSILSNLHHPRIPRYIESFSQEGVNYLVQEFIPGYPLSYLVANGNRFPAAEVKDIINQLLEILVFLHEPNHGTRPVVHRDLRLSNLFWLDQQLYLIDFGLASYYTGIAPAPPQHLPKPDLRRRPGVATYSTLRKEVSPRSDLFGSGVVALDLFTNWITDEAMFQAPWQDILPAGKDFISFLERLLIPEIQHSSASEAVRELKHIAQA